MKKQCVVHLDKYISSFTVEYNVYPAEPDVGLMTDYIDGWRVVGTSLGDDADMIKQCNVFLDFLDKGDDVVQACLNHHFGRD